MSYVLTLILKAFPCYWLRVISGKKGFYLMNLHARRPRIRANMGVSFLEQKLSAIKGNCSNKKTFNV